MRGKLRALALAAAAALWTLRAEILTALAFLAGWLWITSAVAPFAPRIVWRVSLGLLAISAGGWKLLWALITDGLYVLTLDAKGKRRG